MNCERMCTVCRQMKDRAELYRAVKTPEGVVLDTNNKIQGRGAYICKAGDCTRLARKRSALERSLSIGVDSSVYDMLEELAKDAGQ